MTRFPPLRLAAALYAVAIATHFADHLRRGLDASPNVVIALGTLATVLQVTAIVGALAGWAYAPVLAVAIGVGDSVGGFAAHLLPRWNDVLSDPFPGPDPAPGVTALSWVTEIAVITTGLAFAYAGWRAWGARRVTT